MKTGQQKLAGWTVMLFLVNLVLVLNPARKDPEGSE